MSEEIDKHGKKIEVGQRIRCNSGGIGKVIQFNRERLGIEMGGVEPGPKRVTGRRGGWRWTDCEVLDD